MRAVRCSVAECANVCGAGLCAQKESRRVKAMLTLGLCPPVGAMRLVDNNNTVV